MVGWLSEGYWTGRRRFFILLSGIGEYGRNEIISVGVAETFQGLPTHFASRLRDS